MTNKKGRVIAVIGDGALSGGMAFEALNHAGHLQKEMIIILNDNNMSISKSVGALQAYLTNILVSRPYNVMKNLIWDFVQHLPHRVRRRIILSARKLEENMINTLAPNIIFEDLGFKYVGPIDGHNMPRLVRIFNKVKNNMTGSIFVHVVTKKGKGYEHAEEDAPRFHGLGPYEIETGKSVGKKRASYSEIFGDTLCEIARENKKVVAITAAMTDGTGLTGFEKEFPDRFFDVGIAEQHAVTFAGGLAIQGLKPFVAIYSTFFQRAFDQVIHDISLQKLPVVFCLDRAGLVGEDGSTHHGAFDLSYLNLIPDLIVLAPAYANEFKDMLRFAANYNKGPVVIRYPRGLTRFNKTEYKSIELGKYDIRESGKKVALMGIGKAFEDAEIIYGKLRKEFPKLKPYLVNPRFLKPMDTEFLEELTKKVKTIFTIEDNALIGGFGSSIKNYFANTNIEVFSFGIPDQFVSHGNISDLKNSIETTPEQIFEKIKAILK